MKRLWTTRDCFSIFAFGFVVFLYAAVRVRTFNDGFYLWVDMKLTYGIDGADGSEKWAF